MTDARNDTIRALRDFRVGMLTSNEGEDGLRSRPMVIARVTDAGEVDFVAPADAALVEGMEEDRAAILTCQSATHQVSIAGNLRIIDDPKLTDELKQKLKGAFIPEGGAPAVVVRLEGKRAERWDLASERALSNLFSAAKAFAKGERPSQTVQEHVQITL